MNRREFSSLVPALLALGASASANAQLTGPPGKDPKPKQSEVKPVVSAIYTPGPGYGSLPKRVSHRHAIGMLTAGNIRLEMHETIRGPERNMNPLKPTFTARFGGSSQGRHRCSSMEPHTT